MFAALGRFAFRRRRVVLGLTGLFVIFAVVWGSGVFGALGSGGYTPPGVEANRTEELLESAFGRDAEDVDAIAVYVNPAGVGNVEDPAFAGPVTAALDGLDDADVLAVSSYWTPGLRPAERAEFVSADGNATYAVITLEGADQTARLAAYERVTEGLRAGGGVQTYLGGGFTSESQLQALATSDLGTSLAISLPLLLIVLVLVFRGLVAAAIPLALGILAILGSLVLLRMLTAVTEISIFALEISAFLGLGLAIDYGLFMVSRYREELRRTGDPEAALVATTSTAGRTVAFSGLTVVVALTGLLLFPQPASHSFGLGGITVVLFNTLGAIVVLPAMLAVLGHRIDALHLPGRRREETAGDVGFWAGLSRAIMRRPLPWLGGAALVLAVAIAPIAGLAPGLTNHRYLPDSNEGQVALRMINEEFPAGGPAATRMNIAVVGDVTPADLDAYVAQVAATPGAQGAELRRAQPGLAHVTVGWAGEVDDPQNLRLVELLRAQGPPPGAESVLVGGWGGPALALDANAATLDRLPLVIGFVAVVTFLLLFLAFGSLVLPLKAVLVAFLSQAAAFGIIVWGFQEGGLATIMGFTPTGTTDLWTLALISVIAFGLVTDYEVFIVSRIREAYLATGDNETAVATGLQRSGALITRAAVLMIVVVATLGVVANSLFLATVGVGLTLAVVIDATLVRGVLVPAMMRLVGDANWWLPGPLRALHSRIGFTEGGPVDIRPDIDEHRERVSAR
ncbi:MMPL family transporter [Pseudonocardia alaniniphila]|uniref:MMPL family transporter n=1 Tax=Pseudonocardia alaniniphila TaxID=75291 RepID=A0ABS9T9X7_9PSEU|nr:MMPL family transporter [Pseudonocardia alaniniphila]MCH6165096.1 MMPL family transporter [Pseudonocardia alaniniphila]